MHYKISSYTELSDVSFESHAPSSIIILLNVHMFQEEDVKVQRAFKTLLIYVRNIVSNPDEGKFRKIRLSNPAFQVNTF